MMENKKIAMLGGGFIGDFYTRALHGHRRTDLVHVVYSRSESTARKTAEQRGIPHWTTNMKEAVSHPDIDTVVVALPNFQHLEAVRLAAEAGKAVLVTKPLGRNKEEAREMLELVEKHGTLLAPGECFEHENYLRLGFACDTETLRTGLGNLSALLAEHKGEGS